MNIDIKKISIATLNIPFLLATLFLVSAPFTQAETAYIKDEVFVPLRSGPSAQHRILHKGLKSNTQLDILSKSDDNAWFQIRTRGGTEGWLPSQYVQTEATAAVKLAKIENQYAGLKEKHDALSKKFNQVASELKKTQSGLANTETLQQKTNVELQRIKSISSGAIELDKKYQKLLEDHELLQTSNDTLNAENQNLKTDQRFSYMFYGAMLVVLGMFLAVIIPRLKMKKRNSEWVN